MKININGPVRSIQILDLNSIFNSKRHLDAFTNENAKASKIFDYIGGFVSGYDKDSMSLAANLDVLNDPSADIFKKQRAAQDIANQMGVKVKFANLNRGSGGKFNSDDPNAVYINTKHISNAKEFMASLRHELVHRSDNKRGTFIPKDPAQNQFATNYALGMLSMSEKALRLNGRSLNDYSPKVNPNDKTVIADTKYFYSLDQRKSDDFVVAAVPYIAAGALAISSAMYTKYALEKIREENDISNRPVRLRQPSVPEIKYSEESQQSQDSNQNTGQNNQVQAPAPAPLPPEDDDDKEVNKLKVGKDNIGQYKHGGFGNKRILNDGEVKIGQNKNISLDVESGGSGKVNIHMKVDGKKYFYDENSKLFIDTNGKKLSSKITKNEKIQTAIQKALDYANKIKGVE